MYLFHFNFITERRFKKKNNVFVIISFVCYYFLSPELRILIIVTIL